MVDRLVHRDHRHLSLTSPLTLPCPLTAFLWASFQTLFCLFFREHLKTETAVDAEMEIRRDQELEDVLMKRNEDLLPSEAICRELALLCNRVTSALEGFGQKLKI